MISQENNKTTYFIDLNAYYNKDKAIHDIRVNISEEVICRNFNINDLEYYNFIFVNWFRGVPDLYAFKDINESLAKALIANSEKFGRTRVSKFIKMI